METTKIKAPVWFWIIAGIALLWNIMGLMSFVGHAFFLEEAIEGFTEAQKEHSLNQPMWKMVLFAVAVFTGVLGCIGLLVRKKWAYQVFLISFVTATIQMAHEVFLTKAIEVFGLGHAITMPIMVISIAILLLWFSKYSIKKQWLN